MSNPGCWRLYASCSRGLTCALRIHTWASYAGKAAHSLLRGNALCLRGEPALLPLAVLMVIAAFGCLVRLGCIAEAIGETGRIPGFMQQGDSGGGGRSQFAANEKQQHT